MQLVDRVTSILLSPKPTWELIEAEPADTASLYTGYLMLLAAIPAVCGFVGLSLIGVGGFGFSIRVPFVAGLVNMVVSYLLSLATVYVLSLIINLLAPRFGGTANKIQALKVAVYASTASLLGSVFYLLPMLSVLALLAALYSVYLLYTGLPIVMKSNLDKSAAYTAVVIAAAVVLYLVVGAISALFMPRGFGWLGAGDPASVTIASPSGSVVVDTAGVREMEPKLKDATRAIEEAGARGAAVASVNGAPGVAGGLLSGGRVIDAQILKAALPAQLGGLARTGFEAQDGTAVGVSASQVSADYGTGPRAVHLEISDLGSLGAMAAAAFGLVQGQKEDQDHAERTWQENGRTLHESYQKDGTSAEHRMALKNGVIVSITAENTDIATLRSMAAQVDVAALEQLKRPGS